MALESANAENLSLSKPSPPSGGPGGIQSGAGRVGELGVTWGLASVQNVHSLDFYPNSTLLKYSWPLLSELTY